MRGSLCRIAPDGGAQRNGVAGLFQRKFLIPNVA